MAGLSLGSAQATRIVARFQELFAHLGVFSGLRDQEMEQIISRHGEYPMETVLMTAGEGESGLDESQRVYTETVFAPPARSQNLALPSAASSTCAPLCSSRYLPAGLPISSTAWINPL